MKTKAKKWFVAIILIVVVFYALSWRVLPEKITYGVSFSKFHADELQLDWRETYLAIADDLGVKHWRFSAHWPHTEPEQGVYNFTELDYQIAEAETRGADFILAIGRRLPGWPECHEPSWAVKLSVAERQQELKKYLTETVNRYKNSQGLKYWQVENEPFLSFFSRSLCGPLDKKFLEEEIALVKSLDSQHPILITDSGEFGNWWQAYQRGDVFGTSLYLYIWNRTIGPFRYPIMPSFFRIKQSLVELIWGAKPTIIIELSAEPWLIQSIVSTPRSVLQERMGIDKFEEMINFAAKTGFDTQYLWGAEWWYWMKKLGYPAHWERAKELFRSDI